MILPLSVDLGISAAWDEAVHKPTQGPVGGALTALFDCNTVTTNRDPPMVLRLSYAPRVLACVYCGFRIIHVHLEHNLNPAALTTFVSRSSKTNANASLLHGHGSKSSSRFQSAPESR